MNRVGQVWEFGGPDYIGVIVHSDEVRDVHSVMWLVQNHEPGRGDLYPCMEMTFNLESHGMVRLA